VQLRFADVYRKKPLTVFHHALAKDASASLTYIVELDVQSSA
jgi:hypothetical protein